MNELTPLRAAWVAAIIEGEGAIHLFRTRANVSVAMTDRDIIQRLADWTGIGHIHDKPYPPPLKHQWRWDVTRKGDVFDLLKVIRPLLGERRGDRADAALMTIGLHPKRWGAVTSSKWEREKRWRTSHPDTWAAILRRGREKAEANGYRRSVAT